MMKHQYNMDQYIKETSQIHAPADLIRRTKEAVRVEEQRIQKERTVQTGQNIMAYAPKTVSAGTDNIHGKVYKWALPVAAAAVCILMFNIFALRLGGGMKSQSGAAMEMAADEQTDNSMEMYFAASDMADEAAVDADSGANIWAAGAAEESEAVVGDDASAASDSYQNDGFNVQEYEQEYEQKCEITEDYFDEGIAEGSEIGGTALTINETEEAPDFVEDKNTQCITTHGLQFYVTRDWGNKWSAYVCVNESGYVITGDDAGTMDQELFVEKAYEFLAETVEGID